jgi:hypothetical protein
LFVLISEVWYGVKLEIFLFRKDVFDVITSNISFILGANTQEHDVTAGPEKREKVCGASSTRCQAIGYRATRMRIQATD